jgi:hypothetical protein
MNVIECHKKFNFFESPFLQPVTPFRQHRKGGSAPLPQQDKGQDGSCPSCLTCKIVSLGAGTHASARAHVTNIHNVTNAF